MARMIARELTIGRRPGFRGKLCTVPRTSETGRQLLLTMALLAVGAVTPAAQRPFEYSQSVAGRPVRVLVHASDERRAERAARAAFARIATLSAALEDGDADSELRRLETAGRGWTPVSPDLLELLSAAVSIARATDGAFDPTSGPFSEVWREARRIGKVPPAAALDAARAHVGWHHIQIDRGRGEVRLAKAGMRLDLSGIARGYILQQALGTLRMNGMNRALIESGGAIVAGSGPPGQDGWRVEAAAADEAFRRRASALANAALATSTATEQLVEIDGTRYSHVVDPRTGASLTNPVVARVIARDGATASALASAVSVTGTAGLAAILEKFPDVAISVSVAARWP